MNSDQPDDAPSPESKRKTAFATYGGPVDVAGDPEAAAALAALWAVDDADARVLTHGFHAYAGRMHPTTARRAVERFSPPGGRVADPFCGGGTALVAAYAAGRAAQGSDLSPLAVRLARVRTDVMGAAERMRFTVEADRIADRARDMAKARIRPHVPPGATGEFERFDPHVAFELFALREELFAEGRSDGLLRALRLCFSAILVKCLRREAPMSARAETEGRPPEVRKIGRGLPSRWFADRARELALGLEALEGVVPSGTPSPRVDECDARRLEPYMESSFDLVLSSPPYAGIYDYGAEHAVRFAWLGLSKDRMKHDQWGLQEPGLPGANPGVWIEGRRRWLSEMARILVPGGKVVLVVGDGVVGSRGEDAAEATAAAASQAGLRFVARASETRVSLGGSAGDAFDGAPRKEHIVLLEKSAD